MSSSPDARCPRCGGGFHCGAHDTAPCACSNVDLSGELLHHLRERYTACLCLRCLRELAALPIDSVYADRKKPAQSS